MSTIFKSSCIAAGIFLCAVHYGAASNGADIDVDARVVKLLGGIDGISALRSADKVEAYRIKPQQVDDAGDAKTIAQYPVISGPHNVPNEQVKLLKQRLQQARTYSFDVAKGCEFSPGIVVRFVDDGATLDVVFCFACTELVIYLDGKRIGGEDFDNVRTDFVATMKKIFPDDKAIQELN